MTSLVKRDRAIVVGGSIAGLLTARILANHFRQVTIIERDSLLDRAKRSGVPQSNFAHVLVKRGLQIVEELFPGFQDELIAQDARELDIGSDIDLLSPCGWGVRFNSDIKIVSCSRTLLEKTLRNRVLALPQVLIQTGTKVKALLPNSDRTGVAGVTLEHRGSSTSESIFADLIVDASGRNSSLSKWLKALGYEQPEETVIDAHIGYASRIFKIPTKLEKDWQILLLQTNPPKCPKGAIIVPIEGDRWIVGLMGGDNTTPSPNETEWLDFARQLPSHRVYEAIQAAEPISPIMCFRSAENRLRYCERLSRWPENFVALGDAVCSFNPVYGQGMTAAAMGAKALDRCLQEQHSEHIQGMAQKFQNRLAKINSIPWQLSTGEDYRYQTTEGGSPSLITKLMHAYMDRVLQLTNDNIAVRHTLLKVLHLLQPPAVLFYPQIVIPVAIQMFKSITASLFGRSHNQTDRELQAVK